MFIILSAHIVRLIMEFLKNTIYAMRVKEELASLPHMWLMIYSEDWYL